MKPTDAELILRAVAFLCGRGIKVVPWANRFPLWLVDGDALTDDELMALALNLLRTGAGKRRQ